MVAASEKKKPTTRTRRPEEKPHFFQDSPRRFLLADWLLFYLPFNPFATNHCDRLWSYLLAQKLPPRFVKEHLRGSPESAVVHDIDGGAWDVAVERTSTGAFLSGGWAKFVSSHGLQEHEFVVFRYDGDVHFTVVMAFDTTACEKDMMISGELCRESYLYKEVKEEEDAEINLKKFAILPFNKSKVVACWIFKNASSFNKNMDEPSQFRW